MTDQQNDQEPTAGPSRVSIWRTAKGDPRWKVSVRVGEDHGADRRLVGEYGDPTPAPSFGKAAAR